MNNGYIMRFVSASRTWLVATCLVLVLVTLLFFAGRALVVDDARPSDVVIVLTGGFSDVRLQRGLELLQKGYTRELILDESTQIFLGRTYSDYAQDYVQRLPPGVKEHVHVCSFTGDSTKIELRGIWQCAQAADPNLSRVLLVTSQYHTRRALSIANHLLPQYTWTASAAPDPEFGVNWWREREWAKTCFTEWQKLLWWQGFERWVD
ncbi:MAG: YdcF family protein [Terracidiphilus sp.]